MLRSINFYRGLVLGAGLMYLLDPKQGRTRRALLRDRTTGTLHGAGDFMGRAVRDLRRRAGDVVAEPAAHFQPGLSDDEALAEHVRTKLGRYVAHPRAITVSAREGAVTLTGPILFGEAEELIGAVASVRGVREVLNRLEPHDAEDDVPGLRGSGRRAGFTARMSPGIQLVAGVLGATAVAYGAGRIAARLRASRHEELEREMPEYAMLR